MRRAVAHPCGGYGGGFREEPNHMRPTAPPAGGSGQGRKEREKNGCRFSVSRETFTGCLSAAVGAHGGAPVRQRSESVRSEGWSTLMFHVKRFLQRLGWGELKRMAAYPARCHRHCRTGDLPSSGARLCASARVGSQGRSGLMFHVKRRQSPFRAPVGRSLPARIHLPPPGAAGLVRRPPQPYALPARS